MSPSEIFRVETVMLDLRADGKRAALDQMVQHAAKARALPATRKEQVLEMLLERESRGSTGVGGGMAIPHARVPGLRKGCGVVARAPEGIEFRAVDGEPVQVLVMLISPDSRSDEHLQRLRWISALARDPDVRSFILQARTEQDMLDVLLERRS